MKFIILGGIFSFITSLGFIFGNKYKEKEKFYGEFLKFLLNLKSQISFFKTNLLEILSAYNTSNEKLKLLLHGFQEYLLLHKTIKLDFLTNEENFEFNRFIENLGKGDCLVLEEYLDKNLLNFEKKFEEVKIQNLKYGVLYKKLGVLLAFFVCIVLI